MRADFHMHTWYSPDSLTSPQSLINRCLKVGLSCIAVTDHNTIQGAVDVAALAPFQVIIAAEIRSTEGEITGLFLNQEIPAGLSPLETVYRIKDQGGLVSIPHPYDPLRKSVLREQAIDSIMPYVDIIEAFNARNAFKGANDRSSQVGEKNGLLVTAVSDAHHPLELGKTYTEMEAFDGTPEDFKKALEGARLVRHPAGVSVHAWTTSVKWYKRFVRR